MANKAMGNNLGAYFLVEKVNEEMELIADKGYIVKNGKVQEIDVKIQEENHDKTIKKNDSQKKDNHEKDIQKDDIQKKDNREKDGHVR